VCTLDGLLTLSCNEFGPGNIMQGVYGVFLHGPDLLVPGIILVYTFTGLLLPIIVFELYGATETGCPCPL
jgi:hypothetical protein